MMDQNFEILLSISVIFGNFFKFSKRRRAVPLRPIWAIMVAAKLDKSGPCDQVSSKSVNVEGRNAGQRHTHTKTHRQTADKLG